MIRPVSSIKKIIIILRMKITIKLLFCAYFHNLISFLHTYHGGFVELGLILSHTLKKVVESTQELNVSSL
jgi:hypothetical protein